MSLCHFGAGDGGIANIGGHFEGCLKALSHKISEKDAESLHKTLFSPTLSCWADGLPMFALSRGGGAWEKARKQESGNLGSV